VLLLSARNALLSRLVLSGRSEAANTQRFCRIAFGAYNPYSGSGASGVPGAGGRPAEVLAAAATGLLGASGLPQLEERVLGYLCEAAGGVKLMAALDDTGRLLAEVRVTVCGAASRVEYCRIGDASVLHTPLHSLHHTPPPPPPTPHRCAGVQRGILVPRRAGRQQQRPGG
jgi:hypothetical protein